MKKKSYLNQAQEIPVFLIHEHIVKYQRVYLHTNTLKAQIHLTNFTVYTIYYMVCLTQAHNTHTHLKFTMHICSDVFDCYANCEAFDF